MPRTTALMQSLRFHGGATAGDAWSTVSPRNMIDTPLPPPVALPSTPYWMPTLPLSAALPMVFVEKPSKSSVCHTHTKKRGEAKRGGSKTNPVGLQLPSIHSILYVDDPHAQQGIWRISSSVAEAIDAHGEFHERALTSGKDLGGEQRRRPGGDALRSDALVVDNAHGLQCGQKAEASRKLEVLAGEAAAAAGAPAPATTSRSDGASTASAALKEEPNKRFSNRAVKKILLVRAPTWIGYNRHFHAKAAQRNRESDLSVCVLVIIVHNESRERNLFSSKSTETKRNGKERKGKESRKTV